MLDTLLEIWGAIRRNKMRTIATGFAVASGIFLMIILQGASNGIIHTLEKNSGGLAFDVIQVWGGYTSLPYAGWKEGRRIRLDERDMIRATETMDDHVVGATADVSQGGLVAAVGGNGLFYIVADCLGIAARARDPMYACFAAIVLVNMVKTNGGSSDKADI